MLKSSARALCVALLLAAPALWAKPKTVSLAELNPTEEQAQAATWVMRYLTRLHYASRPLDDQLSGEILDGYLDALDSEKLFFLASDIESFARFRTTLDESIERERLDPAFEIYKVYLQRVRERTEYSRSLLEGSFDFSVDESYDYDREEASWPTTRAEVDELWRKRVKSDYLRLLLAERPADKIVSILDERYADFLVRVEQLDREDVFQTFLNAYAEAIEPHTNYLAPRASEAFAINMRLSLEGIGAVLQRDGEYTVVRSVVKGGPADLDGRIKPGDRILGVAQDKDAGYTDVVGWRLEDVVDMIRGSKGTKVRLDVLPAKVGSDGESIDVVIVRDKVKLEEQAARKRLVEVDSGKADGGKRRIGVIELPAFYLDFAARGRGDSDYRSSTRDVKKLLNELVADKVDGIVIDLRNNGGGSLTEATELTGLFIDQGPVVQVRDGRGRVQVEADVAPGLIYEGPLAVLVNRASASASEIFAAAIQDYGRGLIIGDTTFGKGTVQQLVDLDFVNNYDKPTLGQLKMTVAQFFRIDGGSTQHRGVEPDIAFPALYSPEDYGESTYENALPWTQIGAASFEPVGDYQGLVPLLETRHQRRVADNAEYKLLLEDIADLKKARNETSVSLNLAKRQAERKADEARVAARNKAREAILGAEAERNAAKLDDGLLPSERDDDLAAAEEEERKDDERPDVLLSEAAQILGDAIDLNLQQRAMAQLEESPREGS